MKAIRMIQGALAISFILTAGTAVPQTPGPEGPKTSAAAPAPARLAAPTPTATIVPPPSPPQSKGPNVDGVWKDFASARFWILVAVTMFFGGLGGLVYELLILQGQIELPHKSEADDAVQGATLATWKFTWDLGVMSRVIIGALAAVAVLWVLSPPSGFPLLAVSVIAGSAGTAIFRSMEDRLLAVIAQKETVETKKKAEVAKGKVDEVGKSVAKLQAMVGAGANAAMGAVPLQGQPSFNAELQDASRLVSEAKAVFETIR
jgi:hypothetical protein